MRCAATVAVGLAGRDPVRLVGVGERPRGSGLDQGGRSVQGAGLTDQHFQVVVQATAWPTPASRTNARGMRDAFPLPPNNDGLKRTGLKCQCCGRTIVLAVEGLYSTPKRGSSQRFCSPACRQAAYRGRQAHVQEDTPTQQHGGRGRGLNPPAAPTGARSSRHPGANSG